MKLEVKNKWNPWLLIYGAVAVFYLWLASQIPYTHDDWDWGLSVGIQQLLSGSLNSRYAGNFLEVVMTRSELMKTLIMGGIFFGIPFAASRAAVRGNGDPLTHIAVFLLCNALILTMDVKIWQQTYGWVAGFANFAASSLFVCIYFHQVSPLFDEESEQRGDSRLRCVLLSLMGLVMQLFLENVALCMVLLSAAVCVISKIRAGKVGRRYLALLAGNVIGAVIMFSSSIYGSLWSTGAAVDGYRQLSFETDGGIFAMVRSCFDTFKNTLAPSIWEHNWEICVAVCLVLICLWIRRDHGAKKWLSAALMAIDVCAVVYFYYVSNLGYGEDRLERMGLTEWFHFIVNMGFFTVVALQVVLLYRKEKWAMWKRLLVWIAVPLVIAPLAATTEHGPRLFFSSNVLLVLFIAMMLPDALAGLTERGGRLLVIFGLMAALLQFVHLGDIYSDIGACTAERAEILAASQDAKTITLPRYPHEEYLWLPNPGDETRWAFFKEFYGIGQDVEVIIR